MMLEEIENDDNIYTAFHLVLSNRAMYWIFKRSEYNKRLKEEYANGTLTDSDMQEYFNSKINGFVPGHSFAFEYVSLVLICCLQESLFVQKMAGQLYEKPITEMRRSCSIVKQIVEGVIEDWNKI